MSCGDCDWGCGVEMGPHGGFCGRRMGVCFDCYDQAIARGAAVAFGLMGMALAIDKHYVCRICGDYPCDHRNAPRAGRDRRAAPEDR